MKNRSFGLVAFTLFIAAGMGLATTGASRAESVMKACGAEWQAAKANNTTNGMTWQQFLAQCRTQKASATAPAAPAAEAPAPAPAPAQASLPKPAPAPMKPAPAPMKPAAVATGAGEFTTEAEARAHCPSDTVVWVNTKSHIYHMAGTRSYGTTKRGAYMCEADANAAGDRASKSRIGNKAQQAAQ
jgi:hypothetical protein